MNRGPKPKTPKNKPQAPPRLLDADQVAPTIELAGEALTEFRRLVALLDWRGQLDRVDIGHITAAARVWGRLCAALEAADEKTACQLDTLYRGYKRELGLTSHPSHTHVHTTAKSPDAPGDPIRDRIKIA